MTVRYAATPQVSVPLWWPWIAAGRVSAGRWRLRRRNRGCGLIRAIARIVALAVMTDRAHYYQDCGDADCMMFGCRAYKTGFRDGWDKGWDEGYAQGWIEGEAAGFAAGFAAGAASAAGSK